MTDAASWRKPVLRRKRLPQAPSRGHLLVVEAVATETLRALRGFAGPDGRHEGIVLWAGHRLEGDTVVCSCVVPEAEHTVGSVRIGHAAVGAAARAVRRAGLVIVSQVHSHPGRDTRHSVGDDSMILLPFEGMFSLVVAFYGDGGILPEEGSGLHQFQDGRWVLLRNAADTCLVVPPVLQP